MSGNVVSIQAGKERVESSLRNLAIARQAEFEDGSQRVYLHLLADLDPALVSRACHEWALRPRRDYEPTMPSAADLRATVATIAQQDATAARLKLLAPMPVQRDEDGPTFFCLDCFDEPNGWRVFMCPTVSCGRRPSHHTHSYVERCGCYAHNPVIQRKKAAQRVPQQATTTRGKR